MPRSTKGVNWGSLDPVVGLRSPQETQGSRLCFFCLDYKGFCCPPQNGFLRFMLYSVYLYRQILTLERERENNRRHETVSPSFPLPGLSMRSFKAWFSRWSSHASAGASVCLSHRCGGCSKVSAFPRRSKGDPMRSNDAVFVCVGHRIWRHPIHTENETKKI